MINEDIKHFYLERVEDVSGTSGTGIVARGVILPSGTCVLEWLTFHSSICVYKNIDDVEKIHGHEGRTKVVIGDPASPKRSGRAKKKGSKDDKTAS